MTAPVWCWFKFLPCSAMQVRPMSSCGVCVSVTFVPSVKTNKCIFEIFSPSVSQAILVFPYHMEWQYYDKNPLMGSSNAGGMGRNRDSEPISGFIAMLWTMRPPDAVNTVVGRYLAIDWWLMELVLSTDDRPSSGVSQSRCKSVYGTESHAPVNTPKRRTI